MADKNEMEMDELQDDLLLGSDDEEEIISDLDDDMILDEDTLKIAEAYLSDEEEEEDIDFGSEDEEEEAELDFEDRPKRRFYDDEEDVEVEDEINYFESRKPSSKVMLHEGRKPRHLRESTRRTLNELNWKTYANAGKKTVEKGGSIHAQRELNPNGNPKEWLSGAVDAKIRGDKFYDRAKKQFNKDYGYKRGKRYDDDYLEAGMGGDFTAVEEFGPHAVGYRDKGYGEPATYEGNWNDYELKEMSPEEFFGDEKAAKSYRNSQEEIKNWKKGNYEYENGKGYVKKIRESRKLRKSRMMREAVRQARKNHKLQESRKMRRPFSKRRFR